MNRLSPHLTELTSPISLVYPIVITSMVASARFGASKFRNATSSATPTESWYRSNLPATASSTSTSSSLSTFSSEIKTNRRWIVTVTPSGDMSWRGYSEGPVGTMKFGNVGDWDLSRLEDESLVIGGTDGNVSPLIWPKFMSKGWRLII
jgi:hypothetical protein